MEDPRITGFNADEVRAGLLLAMNVGLPPKEEDRPQFVFPAGTADQGDSTDSAGVPLDWRGPRQKTSQPKTVFVPCAIEPFDREGQPTAFGTVTPYRIVLTLLDIHYEQIKGFSYVVLGGIRYRYVHTEPPIGLVSIGVWGIHCVADDEG